jgi:hypothetical protein
MSLQVEVYQRFVECFSRFLSQDRVKDLSITAQLMTQITLERIGQRVAVDDSPLRGREISEGGIASQGAQGVFQRTIEAPETAISVVLEHKGRLEHLLRDHFPFSRVSEEIAKEALTIPVVSVADTLTYQVLNEMLKVRLTNQQLIPDSESWQVMQELVEHLDMHVVEDALEDNYRRCRRTRDSVSGDCFHVLLKMVLRGNDPLPEYSSFGSLVAKMELSLSQLDLLSSSDPPRIIELIFSSSTETMPSFLYQHIDRNKFLNDVVYTLTEIPFEKWPNKGAVITQLFERIPKDLSSISAKLLASAPCDPKTREVGLCFLKASSAKNLREIYPYLYQLCELLPHMNQTHVERLFNCSFPTFCRTLPDDPPCVRRLNFNQKGKVLTHGPFVMGMHAAYLTGDWGKVRKITLLAFDKKSHRLIWGLPIKNEDTLIYCEMHALGLILAYAWDPNIHIFNPENGEERSVVALPTLPRKYDEIHITPSGFCYFRTGSRGGMLYGGEISTGEWKSSFSELSPARGFYPLGNHLCLRDPFVNTQIIFSQDGSMQELAHCNDLLVRNGKLFTIEMMKDGESLLAVQSLEPAGFFRPVQGTRKEVELDIPYLLLEDVCDDDTIFGFREGRSSNQRPCFIDIVRHRFVQVLHRTPAEGTQVIDTKRGALWAWDGIRKILWKHTKEGSYEIGPLQSLGNTTLLYVDEEERLYLTDF